MSLLLYLWNISLLLIEIFFLHLCQVTAADAFLDDSSIPSLGYYKGKLYYMKRGQASIITTVGGESYGIDPAELWEMDTDGRNKRLVTTCWEEGEIITGYMGITYTNGYVDGKWDDMTVLNATSLEDGDITLQGLPGGTDHRTHRQGLRLSGYSGYCTVRNGMYFC